MYIKPFNMQKRIYVHVQTYDCEVRQTDSIILFRENKGGHTIN